MFVCVYVDVPWPMFVGHVFGRSDVRVSDRILRVSFALDEHTNASVIYGTTNLAIHHYRFHNSGAGAEGARPTVVEAAEGRLHIGGWRDWWFHIWYNISYHIWLQKWCRNSYNPSGRIIEFSGRIIDIPSVNGIKISSNRENTRFHQRPKPP